MSQPTSGSKWTQSPNRAAHELALDPQGTTYAASWIDQLERAIERLPGSCLLGYALVGLLLVFLHAAIKWADGSYPVGTFYPFHVVVMLSGVWFLALPHYLNWSAMRALERFRAALQRRSCTESRLAFVLTTLPARPTNWVTVAGFLFGILVV